MGDPPAAATECDTDRHSAHRQLRKKESSGYRIHRPYGKEQQQSSRNGISRRTLAAGRETVWPTIVLVASKPPECRPHLPSAGAQRSHREPTKAAGAAQVVTPSMPIYEKAPLEARAFDQSVVDFTPPLVGISVTSKSGYDVSLRRRHMRTPPCLQACASGRRQPHRTSCPVWSVAMPGGHELRHTCPGSPWSQIMNPKCVACTPGSARRPTCWAAQSAWPWQCCPEAALLLAGHLHPPGHAAVPHLPRLHRRCSLCPPAPQ